MPLYDIYSITYLLKDILKYILNYIVRVFPGFCVLKGKYRKIWERGF